MTVILKRFSFKNARNTLVFLRIFSIKTFQSNRPIERHLSKLSLHSSLPLVLTAIFGFLLLLALGQFINTFTAHRIKIIPISANKAITPAYNLADLHLLGVYTASLDTLPDTTLQLTLEGTAVDLNHPNASRAVIDAPGHAAKIYQIGNALPGNATMTRIDKYYVVVNDNGTLEKLPLPIETISP